MAIRNKEAVALESQAIKWELSEFRDFEFQTVIHQTE